MDLDDKLVELPEEVGKAFSSDTEYVLLDHIGGGGSRIVHRGWDENWSEFRAVKIYQQQPWGPQGTLQQANHSQEELNENEGKNLGKLKHDNIVRIWDKGNVEVGEKVWEYSVEEFVKGQNLDDLTPTLNQSEKEDRFGQLLDALSFMHSKKVAHRDIKPENVMVTEDGDVQLTDLQFSVDEKDFDTWKGYHGVGDATPPDMKDPEIKADYGFDVYSLGVTLFDVLTGDKESMHNLFNLNKEEYDRTLDEKLQESGISKKFIPFLRTALAYDKSDRFSNAIKMNQEYKDILEEKQKRKKRLRGIFGVAAGLLIGGGILLGQYLFKEPFDAVKELRPVIDGMHAVYDSAPLLDAETEDVKIVRNKDEVVFWKPVEKKGKKFLHISYSNSQKNSDSAFLFPDVTEADDLVQVKKDIFVTSELEDGLRFRAVVYPKPQGSGGMGKKNYIYKGPDSEGFYSLYTDGTFVADNKYGQISQKFVEPNIGNEMAFRQCKWIQSNLPLSLDEITILTTNPSPSRIRILPNQVVQFGANPQRLESTTSNVKEFPFLIWSQMKMDLEILLDGEPQKRSNFKFPEEGVHTVDWRWKKGDLISSKSWKIKVANPDLAKTDLSLSHFYVRHAEDIYGLDCAEAMDGLVVDFIVKSNSIYDVRNIRWKLQLDGIDQRSPFKCLNFASKTDNVRERIFHTQFFMDRPSPGDHSLSLRIDPLNQIQEYDETNNEKTVNIDVKKLKPEDIKPKDPFREMEMARPLSRMVGRSLELAPVIWEDRANKDRDIDHVVNSADGKQQALVKYVMRNGRREIQISHRNKDRGEQFSFYIPDISPNDETFTLNRGLEIHYVLPSGAKISCQVSSESQKHRVLRTMMEKRDNQSEKEYPLMFNTVGGGSRSGGAGIPRQLYRIVSDIPLDVPDSFLVDMHPKDKKFSVYAWRPLGVSAQRSEILKNQAGYPNDPDNLIRDMRFVYTAIKRETGNWMWALDWSTDRETVNNQSSNYFQRFMEPGRHTIEAYPQFGTLYENPKWIIEVLPSPHKKPDVAVVDLKLWYQKENLFLAHYDMKNLGFAPITKGIDIETYLDGKLIDENFPGNNDAKLFTPKRPDAIQLIGVHRIIPNDPPMVKGMHTYKVILDPKRKIDDYDFSNNQAEFQFEVK